MNEKPTVGVIGLGRVGAGVARRAAPRGFQVRGYDVVSSAASELAEVLQPAASPAEVGRTSDVVLIAVLNDDQIRTVLTGEDGLLSEPGRPDVAVILSTATMATIRWAADECGRAGVALLDCGVSGGAGGFDGGTFTAMVGGEAQAFERARPVLDTFADPVLHMGPLGRGMAAKLARNVLVYTDWFVAWEAARLAQAAGVDVAKFVQAVKASDRYVSGHTALIAHGLGLGLGGPPLETWAGGGTPLSVYADKDLRAAIELSDELGVEMPAARLALSRVPDFTEGAGR